MYTEDFKEASFKNDDMVTVCVLYTVPTTMFYTHPSTVSAAVWLSTLDETGIAFKVQSW